MAWKETTLFFTLALAMGSRLFADAAVIQWDDDSAESNLQARFQEIIIGRSDKNHDPVPESRPPDTVDDPKRIIFTEGSHVPETELSYSGKQDPDPIGVNIVVGSKEDELASRWKVVTSSGYEYDGSDAVVEEIFGQASSQEFGGSIDELIAEFGLPKKDDGIGILEEANMQYTPNGPDNRVRIQPYHAIGQIGLGCTGTFIGRHHILTAAHCIYDRSMGQWFQNLNFRRAKDCDPDGGHFYQWKMALVMDGYIQFGLRAYDIGMIIVNQDYPFPMFFGHSSVPDLLINVVGYPGDIKWPSACQWWSTCRADITFYDFIVHRCTTAGGMSGSGIHVYFPSASSEYLQRVIYCVHTDGGFYYNGCSRITLTKYYLLHRWIQDY